MLKSFYLTFTFLFLYSLSFSQAVLVDRQRISNAFADKRHDQLSSILSQEYDKVSGIKDGALSELEFLSDAAFRAGDLILASQIHLSLVKKSEEKFGDRSSQYFDCLEQLLVYKSAQTRLKAAIVLGKNFHKRTKEHFGKNSENYVRANVYLGELSRLYGDYESADGYFQSSLEIAEGLGAFGDEHALAASNYAQLLLDQGKYTQAEVMIRKAMHIYQKAGMSTSMGYVETLIIFAELNSVLHNYASTDKYLKLALSQMEGRFSPRNPYMLRAEIIYAKTLLNAGYPTKSLEVLSGTERSSDQLPLVLADSKIMIGNALAANAEFDQAELKFEEAVMLLVKEFGHHHLAVARVEQAKGEMLYKKGEYDAAEKSLSQALTIRKDLLEVSHPDYLETITNLSLVEWANGNMTSAAKYFRKATKNYVYQYKTQFVFLSEKEKSLFYKGIKEYFEKFNAFALEYKVDRPSIVGKIYDYQMVTKGLLFNSTKDLRQNIFKKPSIFNKYNRFVESRELLARAYNIHDQSVLDNHNLNIDSLENAVNYLEKELSFRIEESKTSDERMKEFEELFLTWKDVRFVLEKGEAAVELVRFRSFDPKNGGQFLDDAKYLALAVNKNTKKWPELIVLDDGEFLEKKAIKFYRNSVRYKFTDVKSYDSFWAKIAESNSLRGIETVYFSPDGVYNQLSLNTLYNADQSRYLLDEIQLNLVSNVKDLLDMRNGQKQLMNETQTLLIGYPDYNEKIVEGLHLGEEASASTATDRALPNSRGFLRSFLDGETGIAKLPGTLQEVNSINEILRDQGQKVDLKTDQAADEEVLKALKGVKYSPNVLHIATHGYFLDIPEETLKDGEELSKDEINPLNLSGLLLAGATFSQTDLVTERALEAYEDNKMLEDGNLTAYEAMNLNLLNTEMVIMSACETGLGVVKNGEGVYGLQRAFQTAGAKSICMSLWKVDDEATEQFMIEFYKQKRELGDKRAAFRAAQLKLREKYPEPLYWGAFVLVGV